MTTASPQPAPSEARAEPRSAALPGWLASCGLHAAVLAWLVTAGLPSCGGNSPGVGPVEDGLREVGVYVKSVNELTDSPEDDAEGPPDADQPAEQPNPATTSATSDIDTFGPAPATDSQAIENLIDLPKIDAPPLIGLGPLPAGGGAGGAGNAGATDTLVTPNDVATPPIAGEGRGDVSFMGMKDTAQRVVYLIDGSSSMSTGAAIQYAKAKLMESVNRLDASQRFQVITYTDKLRPMRLRDGQAVELYRADQHTRVLATRHIGTITASGGTEHMPALEAAFNLNPDVIFFLTDAAQERLTPAQLDRIRRTLNRGGRAAIHCIKFGQGPDLEPEEQNFLRTLARQNGGSYTYVNIDRITR
jgi:hypothetical protein